MFQAAEACCMDDLRRRVVDLVHASFRSASTIFWLTNKDNIMIDPVMRNIQDQFLLPYKSYFFKHNPFDPVNIHLADRPSVLMEHLIAPAEFHRTEYFIFKFQGRPNLCPPCREICTGSYISRGFTNLEIAGTLFISEGTVKNHLKHIFVKTRATNRTRMIHKTLFSDPECQWMHPGEAF